MSRARAFIELWNAGRVRDALVSAAPDYTYQDAVAGGPHDRDGHIALMEAILEQVPDRKITIHRAWDTDGVEFLEYHWTGTPRGGEPISSDWLAIFEFTGAKLRRQRHYRGE